MTLDSALLHRPTESLILPTKRRFFPLKIPNFHHQLRHYISTADPDRIYVVVDKVVYSIHISSQKREPIADIPFEPRCLAAGYGWIGVGAEYNGECAFIRMPDQSERTRRETPTSQHSDVDSALPIDLEPTGLAPWASNERSESGPRSARRQSPEFQMHKFGGSIVNSVTIHRFPGGDKGLADEDVIVLSNNDQTVTIYSLTRAKVLKVLHHKTCMNYAVISPDSKLLAAVGDEHRAYFYEISRDFDTIALTETDEKLTGWDWSLLRCVEMDVRTSLDEGCCFTIAFSPESRLCAVGSQSGIIAVFNVPAVLETLSEPHDRNTIICYFHSSRPSSSAGAVRSMSFSPEPWDLLVWVEDRGRAGVVDVRQAFTRRQQLDLDINQPGLQEVPTDPVPDSSLPFDFDSRSYPESPPGGDTPQRAMLDPVDDPANEGRGDTDFPWDEGITQDPTERGRLIVEFLNTARWTSRLEDDLTERPVRASLNLHHATHPRLPGSTDGGRRASRPTSPMRYDDALHSLFRDSHSGRGGNADRSLNARRQSSVVLSQDNAANRHSAEGGSSSVEGQPNITLSWTASPSELQSTTSDRGADPTASDPSTSSNEGGMGTRPHETTGRQSGFDPYGTAADLIARRRTQRSSSIPRRSERPDVTSEGRYDQTRLLNSEMRANVAAERLRRQRLHPNPEVHSRTSPWEQRHRQQHLGGEQSRSARWARLNNAPERSLAAETRDDDPSGTAGIGWGADTRTLYIATVAGVFEYQINIPDRKTFPVLAYR